MNLNQDIIVLQRNINNLKKELAVIENEVRLYYWHIKELEKQLEIYREYEERN